LYEIFLNPLLEWNEKWYQESESKLALERREGLLKGEAQAFNA